LKKYNFNIQDILTIGLVLVVTGIALAVGLQIMGDVRTDQQGDSFNASDSSTWSTAYNASGQAIDGVAKLPEKMPLIATVVVAAIVIGVLVRYLFVKLN
jgi:uncharacterized protein YjeT (DUF2065 family)